MRLRALVFLMVALFTASCAALTQPRIEFHNAWVREAKISAISQEDLNKSCICDVQTASMQTNAYLKIINPGFQADRLTGAESEAITRIEFRRSGMSGEPSPLEAIEIPARGEVYFAPGSYAMLLMGMKEDLEPGAQLKLTLIFEKAGRQELLLDIQPKDYTP